jgi:nucleoid-associated protein YgaU
MGTRAQDGSQDVAEAARQERARKAARAQSAQEETHVYTNDDLRRSHILLEADSARVAARKLNSAPTRAVAAEASALVSENAKAIPAGDTAKGASESLDVVARRYRQEKIAREAMRASGDLAASHFRLEIPASSLAELAPRVAPGGTPNSAPYVGNSVAPRVAGHAPSHLPQNIAPHPAIVLLPARPAKTVEERNPRRRDPFSRPAIGLAAERSSKLNVISPPPIPALPELSKTTMPLLTGSQPASLKPAPASLARDVIGKPMGVARVVAPPNPGSRVVRERVTIRAGDSLWGLSRRYLGRGLCWREWLVSNSGLSDPRTLRAGAVLVVPRREDESPPLAGAVEPAETQRTVVRKGDSLWKIAAERYGDGMRWSCLARANSGLLDARWIYPGQMLTLPPGCRTGVSHLSANSAILH